jgi:hypothetical protein
MIQKTTVMDWTLASRQCCEWISGDDEAGCEETVTKQRVVLENLGAVGSGADGALVAGGCWCWLSYPLGPPALVLVKLYGCNGGLM